MRDGDAVADAGRAQALPLQERVEDLTLRHAEGAAGMGADLLQEVLLAVRPQARKDSFGGEEFEPHR
jgi:hypothetical protein